MRCRGAQTGAFLLRCFLLLASTSPPSATRLQLQRNECCLHSPGVMSHCGSAASRKRAPSDYRPEGAPQPKLAVHEEAGRPLRSRQNDDELGASGRGLKPQKGAGVRTRDFRAEGSTDFCFDLIGSAALGQFHGECRVNFISKARETRRRRQGEARRRYYPDKSACRWVATGSGVCSELWRDQISLKIKGKDSSDHQRFLGDRWRKK